MGLKKHYFGGYVKYVFIFVLLSVFCFCLFLICLIVLFQCCLIISILDSINVCQPVKKCDHFVGVNITHWRWFSLRRASQEDSQGRHRLGGEVTVTVTVVVGEHKLGLGTKLPSSSTSNRGSGIPAVANTGAGSACLRCLAGSGLPM